MANYCSNTMYIEGATVIGTQQFNDLVENDALDAGDQYVFDIQTTKEEVICIIYFTTKWSLHDETIEFLMNLLEADSSYCYYEEPGMALAGKITYDSDGISNEYVISQYWDDFNDLNNEFLDYPEIEDYLTERRCLMIRFSRIIYNVYPDGFSNLLQETYSKLLLNYKN